MGIHMKAPTLLGGIALMLTVAGVILLLLVLYLQYNKSGEGTTPTVSTPKGVTASTVRAHTGEKFSLWQGGSKTSVSTFTLEDGTKCVVVAGETYDSGRGVSCNWKKEVINY